MKKISTLQVTLTVIFTTALLISNIITSKQIMLPFGITMTAAIFVFPITYILSDVFSEIYGYKWSRLTCYMAFAMNVFMVIAFTLTIHMPFPAWWDNQAAFQAVLGNTPRILFASLLAFVAGDFINDRIFRRYKNKYPDSHKGFGLRAIVSSLCGEIVDSCIFLPIAFIGNMPVSTLFIMMIFQVVIKTGYEVVILPITYAVINRITSYEAKQQCPERRIITCDKA